MYNVAFLHGLESAPRSFKNEILESQFGAENVYAPEMNYRLPEMFSIVLKHLTENPVDIIIGSSMGGYFAHALSSHLNKPSLLFNPAIHSRTFEPQFVNFGDHRPTQVFVLGRQDEVINPLETLKFISNPDCDWEMFVGLENMGHRVLPEVFEKWINQYI